MSEGFLSVPKSSGYKIFHNTDFEKLIKSVFSKKPEKMVGQDKGDTKE